MASEIGSVMGRSHKIDRTTKETSIQVELEIDGSGKSDIKTGIGFLDHMLDLLAFHSRMDIKLHCDGDIEVCGHHSIEDIGLALGECFLAALGDRKGISRYATCFLPMDECLTRTVVDISGRPFHVFKGFLTSPMVGEFPTEMTKHFFTSFASKANMTLHQEILYGENDHHRIESLFKGLARAIKEAAEVTGDVIPSSKGVL